MEYEEEVLKTREAKSNADLEWKLKVSTIAVNEQVIKDAKSSKTISIIGLVLSGIAVITSVLVDKC